MFGTGLDFGKFGELLLIFLQRLIAEKANLENRENGWRKNCCNRQVFTYLVSLVSNIK